MDNAKPKETIEELNQKELSALISRVEHAINHDLALTLDDMKMLLLAIHTLCTVQQKLENNAVTLHKLRKLLGIVKQSESRNHKKSLDDSQENSSGNNNTGNNNTGNNKKTTNKKSPRKKPKPPPKVIYKLTDYHSGQVCTACNKGKLYKFTSGRLLRITGHGPYEAIYHITERLRCNTCGQCLTAPLPEFVLADGKSDQQYGYSARSLMSVNKFYSGTPYYHQGNVADIFGCYISPSTIFDQCEATADAVMPVYYEIERQSSKAISYLLDDTPNRILCQQPELRNKRKGKGKQLRTGVYSSGLIALTEQNHELVLFETSLGHAGELLDKILNKRPANLPKALTMSDALGNNNPIEINRVLQCYCNAHCRRQFIDLAVIDESLTKDFLDTYDKIWENDRLVKSQGLNAQERLEYHREHSLPLMESLHEWAIAQQKSSSFEEHGALGKAIAYLLRHFDKLTMFCKVPGALIDNNRMEETLKMVIRGRKLSHFYQTVNGAGVANVLLSIIATAHRAGANIYEYLLALQCNQKLVRASPSSWMPWNYQKQLDNKLKEPDPPSAEAA